MVPNSLRTVIATVAIGLCAGCTTVVTGSATSLDPVADPRAPGTCLALATADVEVMTTFVPRVACDDPSYTAQVFATADLSGLDAGAVTDLTRDEVATAIGSACEEPTLYGFLGADPVETPFVFTTFFTPIESQWDLGARWAYCVVAYGNENDAPELPVSREVRTPPGALEGAFDTSSAAVMRACYADAIGDAPCSEPHRFEYIGHEVLFGFFPVWPPDIPDFIERASAECLAAQPAYVTALPPGYGVAFLFPGPDLFDPTLEFKATCVVGPLGEEAPEVTGSLRD